MSRTVGMKPKVKLSKNSTTVESMKAELTKLGVSFDAQAKKEELNALLQEALLEQEQQS